MSHFPILFLFMTFFHSGSFDNSSTIHLKIDNLKNKKGKILINLFNKEKGFPDSDAASFKSWVLEPKSEFELNDIPPGKYALSLLHDEDGNYKMTYNFFRFPIEGFAFSNFNSSVLRIPKFEQAKFEHKKEGTKIILKIVY